jgi:prepilin-type N-terminal cleavage/methylation domain-containing protein
MKNGFTLIELLIVIAIAGMLIAFSISGTSRFRNSLEYSNSVSQVLSDIKLAQQLAETSAVTCSISFEPSSGAYSILKSGKLYRSVAASKNIRFSGKTYFEFLRSGDTGFGGSGTLIIGGSSKPKKIVVSQRGRIRIE